MYYSWLLLFVSFSVFSNMSAVPVQKRGLIPSNINIEIKLGKQSTPKPVDTPREPGTRKTVINAPFGLASLTISTSHNKNPQKNSATNETNEPCLPETESISQDATKNTPQSEKEALGGKGSAFFGLPPPPPHHGFFGPPPPPPPPYFHHHDHDCHHQLYPPPPPSQHTTSNKIPNTTSAEKVPNVPNTSSTTENVNNLIDDIFGNSSSSTSTANPQNVDLTDREKTGEGSIDIRMPLNN